MLIGPVCKAFPTSADSTDTSKQLERPYGIFRTSTNTTNGATKRHDNTNIRTVLIEPSYLAVGADTSQTPVMNCYLKFDYFKDTIGELKQLFFTGGQDLVIEVYWSNLPNILWTSTSLTDPTASAVANAGNGAISNLCLMITTELDSEILAWTANKYNTEGFKYNFRTVITSKEPSSASTQHQVDARLTTRYGKRLFKVYWVLYNNTETTNTIYDHDNRLGNKIAQYQTYFDNKLIPNSWYNIGTGAAYALCDDYDKNKERLRGSCILSKDEYYYNFCATIDFTLERPKDMPPAATGVIPESNLEEGIMLSPFETKITFIGQCPGSTQTFAHYIFSVVKRELHMTPSAIACIKKKHPA